MNFRTMISLVASCSLLIASVGCERDVTPTTAPVPATNTANLGPAGSSHDAVMVDLGGNEDQLEKAENDSEENASEAPAEAPRSKTASLRPGPSDPTNIGVGANDWPQWGGSIHKNNVPAIAADKLVAGWGSTSVVSEWDPGQFDRDTGEWIPDSGQNIKWVARLGSQTYGNPVVANGQVFVGTNNGAGYIERYPFDVDLGVLACFRESDGEFLWQHSSEKLIVARVQDWPLQGICCAPCVEGDRLWFVTSRGVVACLDTQGFRDGENDGPYTSEEYTTELEADTVWEFDMLKEIRLFQHNMCACSVTVWGDYLFVNTSNGVDESHINIPSPEAPSFMALNKNTGELLWTDNSPGINIVHGQWSSPAFAVIDGQPMVMFPGGDGFVRAFDPAGDANGNAKLLWEFDCNPKESKWVLGGRGTRNNLIGTPVIYDDKVYIAVGQDPEHGEGIGHLWCIDPTKRGDISPTQVFDSAGALVPHSRLQAAVPEKGHVVRDNENSGAIWHYSGTDMDENGEMDWEEEMHRSVATVAIKDDLLYVADFSGLFHCVDAQTGKAHWMYDMFAAAWGSALIVDGKVYVGDEDGDVMVFKHGNEMELISEINMGNAVYSTPIIANGVLYIANKSHLFAIVEEPAESEAATDEPESSEGDASGQ